MDVAFDLGSGSFTPPTPCCSRSRESDRRDVKAKIDNLSDNQKKKLETSAKNWRTRFISGIKNNS